MKPKLSIPFFGFVILLVSLHTAWMVQWKSTQDDRNSKPVSIGPLSEKTKANPAVAGAKAFPPASRVSADTLTGEAAKETLRKNGQYASLAEAFAAARHAVERIDPTGPYSRGAEYFVSNPGQKLGAWFRADGVELTSACAEEGAELWSLTLRLRATGRAGAMTAAGPRIIWARGNRIEMIDTASGVTEWYENRRDGIEQGFTVAQAPGGEGPMEVLLAVDGSVHAQSAQSDTGEEVRFIEASGHGTLHCKGLKAWDATGRAIPARMELRRGELAFLVFDAGASYPITVDPLFSNVEARLSETSVAFDEFGSSVALSGDTALIGAPRYGFSSSAFPARGRAYVFVRSVNFFGPTWIQQAELIPNGSTSGDLLGVAVALDGDTALIGAPGPNDTSAVGSAYIFVRSGVVWSHQATLTAGDGVLGTHLGEAVALSGNTALVGAPRDDAAGSDAGCAYVFVRTGTQWTQQGPRLLASDPRGLDYFGSSVALSGDTALVGSRFFYLEAGRVYVFVRSGTQWTSQQTLIAPDAAAEDRFGNSVAVSGDTALVGAPGHNTAAGLDAGSAYLFVRNGAVWSPQGPPLTAYDARIGAYFGRAVTLNGDTAIVGSCPSFGSGSAYAFVRSGGVWSPQGPKLTPPGDRETSGLGDGFGSSVALSGDLVLVGAPTEDTRAGSDAGSVYEFTRNVTQWSNGPNVNADDGAQNDSLGSSVALSGNTALVAAGGAVYVFVRSASLWSQQARLTSPAFAESFGTSVALNGDTALVGAYDPIYDLGSAYVFVRSGMMWSQQAKLRGREDISERDSFGYSVALTGDTAIVGDPHSFLDVRPAPGSAYVFVRNGSQWIQQGPKLTVAGDSGSFGSSVALSGNTALVGAAESAHVFLRNGSTWEPQGLPLAASDGTLGDNFGISVALTSSSNISFDSILGQITPPYAANMTSGLVSQTVQTTDPSQGGRALYSFSITDAGDYTIDALVDWADDLSNSFFAAVDAEPTTSNIWTGTTTTGLQSRPLTWADDASAHVFTLSSGTHSLIVRGREANAKLGHIMISPVAPRPLTALVGASRDDTPAGTDAGSVYVFVRNGTNWSQQAKLTASDGAAGDNFGRAVALSGERALVGSPSGSFAIQTNGGSARVFVRSGTVWTQLRTLNSGVDASPGDSFGSVVALDGDTALVGAPRDTTLGNGTGSAYVFRIGELPEITAQPASRTVLSGVSVSFSVTATGYAPLHYQWRRNGSDILGATGPSYSIASATPADAGSYDAVVYNIGGVVTSAAAVLVVNNLSQFAQSFPGPAPSAPGFVLVNVLPPLSGAGWRIIGEKQWRAPGIPLAGLTFGQREIEFRPVPGYNHPPRETVILTTNSPFASLEFTYYERPKTNVFISGLSVTLKPDSILSQARWRFLGEDDTQWRVSTNETGLVPGSYLLECKPVDDYVPPPPTSVVIKEGEPPAVILTYGPLDAQSGAPAQVVPFETVSTSTNFPYGYVGQIRSDAGLASGFVVKPWVVATAAHVVFNDVFSSNGTPSYVTGLQWLFQRDQGIYDPIPEIPRGFYLFDGYAVARGRTNVVPGEGTPESQQFDVAALYFTTNAPGRGGYSGFLASDASGNEFLLSDANKILVGYPIDKIDPSRQGRMHATAPTNVAFSRVLGEVEGVVFRTYESEQIRSTGGSSGGPLCVQFEGGGYYPAAIYLGGSKKSVVRAIDSDVIKLFERAQTSAVTGVNNNSEGVSQNEAPAIGSPTAAGSLIVFIEPQAAINAGARWMLVGDPTPSESGWEVGNLTPGPYTLQFTTVDGFAAPPRVDVVVVGGKVNEFTNTYGTVAEVDVQGQGNSIVDGDVTPSLSDDTDFGSVDIAVGSVVRTFTIRSTGSGTLTLGSNAVSLSGTHSNDFTVSAQPATTVAPGGSTTFTVGFDPSVLGLRTATVSIANDNVNKGPYEFAIQGTGTAAPEMDVLGQGNSIANGDVTPSGSDDTDFGSADIGGAGVVHSFTIRNTGSGILTLGANAVSLSGSSDFAVSQQSEQSVSAGGSTTFRVRFDPSVVGLRMAMVSIANDDVNENPYGLAIQGTGTRVEPPRIIRSTMQVDGTFLIEYSTLVDHTYVIQYSSDLKEWMSVVPGIVGTGGPVFFQDNGPPITESKPSSQGVRFYRILAD